MRTSPYSCCHKIKNHQENLGNHLVYKASTLTSQTRVSLSYSQNNYPTEKLSQIKFKRPFLPLSYPIRKLKWTKIMPVCYFLIFDPTIAVPIAI
jgi:hypothetical protein